MRPLPHLPLTYLITSNRLAPETTNASSSFRSLVEHVAAAARAGVKLIQIREKHLNARTLFRLVAECVCAARDTETRLLVNDRLDIARVAGADGVHLTTCSVPIEVVRQVVGDNLLIGVSTHSLEEATQARDAGADFATFSPIYETPSKAHLGLPPVGLAALRQASAALTTFPLIALGGITSQRITEVLQGGAAGVAGIRLFDDESELAAVVRTVDKQTDAQQESRVTRKSGSRKVR